MEQKQLKRRFLTAAVLVAVAAALLVGGVATYAWFTSNQQVGTSRAVSSTGQESIELLISSTGGADFKGSSVADITQVNQSNSLVLMPVSTADLNTFYTAAAYNGEGYPSDYKPVEDEQNYYHGRIWLRASGDGVAAGSQMALYLDQREASGGLLAQKTADQSLLLNAARLGLVLEGGSRAIFYLSDEKNPIGERLNNTYFGETLQAENIVIAASGSGYRAAADPAMPISASALGDDGLLGTPLGYLDFDRIYALDVYFYLEGCDPDCYDSISFDASDLHLAFYGVLA